MAFLYFKIVYIITEAKAEFFLFTITLCYPDIDYIIPINDFHTFENR